MADRLAMAGTGALHAWSPALIDGAFLPGMTLVGLRTPHGFGQPRTYALVGSVVVLAAANLAMHAEALGGAVGIVRPTRRGGRGRAEAVRRDRGSTCSQSAPRPRWRLAHLVWGRTALSALLAGAGVTARFGGWYACLVRDVPAGWELQGGSSSRCQIRYVR